MITMSILKYILFDILLICGGMQLGILLERIIDTRDKKQKKKERINESKKTMTLKEAIEHCEEKAKGNSECAEEHAQLAEWLKELKERRREDDKRRSD